MAAAASPQPPPSTRCTSRSRPPLSRGQALAASSAHSCECSSGRSSDHVCECRNPQPDRTPPDEQPSQQRHLAELEQIAQPDRQTARSPSPRIEKASTSASSSHWVGGRGCALGPQLLHSTCPSSWPNW